MWDEGLAGWEEFVGWDSQLLLVEGVDDVELGASAPVAGAWSGRRLVGGKVAGQHLASRAPSRLRLGRRAFGQRRRLGPRVEGLPLVRGDRGRRHRSGRRLLRARPALAPCRCRGELGDPIGELRKLTDQLGDAVVRRVQQRLDLDVVGADGSKLRLRAFGAGECSGVFLGGDHEGTETYWVLPVDPPLE